MQPSLKIRTVIILFKIINYLCCINCLKNLPHSNTEISSSEIKLLPRRIDPFLNQIQIIKSNKKNDDVCVMHLPQSLPPYLPMKLCQLLIISIIYCSSIAAVIAEKVGTCVPVAASFPEIPTLRTLCSLIQACLIAPIVTVVIANRQENKDKIISVQ